MAELQRSYPDEEARETIARLKRQAITELSADGIDPQTWQSIVARLAMGITLVRGVPPGNDEAFSALGRKLLNRVAGLATFQGKVDQFVPAAAAGAASIVYQLQPALLDMIFRALPSGGQGKAGLVISEVAQAARSWAWRNRHSTEFVQVAAAGAGTAIHKAVGAGTARLTVMQVDRALTVPKK